MKRPLTMEERLAVHLREEEGLGDPAVARFLAALGFLLGQLIGPYPTGRAQIEIGCDEAVTELRLHIDVTVPLDELAH